MSAAARGAWGSVEVRCKLLPASLDIEVRTLVSTRTSALHRQRLEALSGQSSTRACVRVYLSWAPREIELRNNSMNPHRHLRSPDELVDLCPKRSINKQASPNTVRHQVLAPHTLPPFGWHGRITSALE